MATTAQRVEQEEARGKLRELLPHGSRVYTILRRVSSSGMRRHISTVIVRDSEIHDITWLVGRAIGTRRDLATGGLIVDGAGMDMGFDIVYRLSSALFCPDTYDHDAAYALERVWL